MDFADVVRSRRMVRDYDPDRSVPPATVAALLDLATRAPSAGFTQGWGFLVLADPADRAAFWRAVTPTDRPARPAWRAGMARAPLVVVPCSSQAAYLDRYARADKGWTDRDPQRWPVPYWHVDAGFAALLVLLGAVDAGLGACFFGIPGPRVPALRAAFGIPGAFAPVGGLTVGYPARAAGPPAAPRRRRPAAEVVHHGRWGAAATPVGNPTPSG